MRAERVRVHSARTWHVQLTIGCSSVLLFGAEPEPPEREPPDLEREGLDLTSYMAKRACTTEIRVQSVA